MDKKQATVSFLNLVISGKIREAYDKHISPNFRGDDVGYRPGSSKGISKRELSFTPLFSRTQKSRIRQHFTTPLLAQ